MYGLPREILILDQHSLHIASSRSGVQLDTFLSEMYASVQLEHTRTTASAQHAGLANISIPSM
jgi:hypothetical protein